MRRLLRRLFWLALLLITALLAWGGYYLCNHGFSRHWRSRISEEFRKRGVDLYVHRLTLDPVQGLVAREVRIYDTADPERILATIDRVALDLNLTNLLHHKTFLDAVDLRNASLSLPLHPDAPASQRFRVSHLNARILLPPHEWYVSQADATVYGIQVSAHGRLLNPEAFQPGASASPPHAPGGPDLALDVLRQLESIHFAGTPPRLELELNGDLADPSSLYASATLWAEHIRRGESELTQLYGAISYRNQMLELNQLNVGDGQGELDASGSWDFQAKRASLQVRSTLDPRNVTRVLKLANPLEDWKFAQPPLLEFAGHGSPGLPFRGLVTGHLRLGPFTVRGEEFKVGSADFSWDGESWYVRNGLLSHRSGAVRLRALLRPGQFRARLESDLNPNSLRPLLPGAAARALSDWDFQQSPHFSLALAGTGVTPGAWEARGQVQLGRTRMRGVPLVSGSSGVTIKGQTFTYKNFAVHREEGAATGSFAYDFDRHQAWLTDIHAHLNTTEAAVWIDPDLARQVAPYRFKTAPNVTLNGFVQCANDKGTHLEVQVDAPGGMDYTFCRRNLSFSRLSGDLIFTERHLQIKDVKATLSGGALGGGAEISLARNAPGYTARLQVDHADFASLTRLFFNYQSSHGLLDGRFDFAGRGDDPRTLQGRGRVTVSQGNVFAIPVLGPFSGILNSIVPGLGYSVAHDASCDFAVDGGAISTRDFLVKGKGFSMIGDGRLFFLEDRLNFNIRLNAQGLPGVLLFPVSKLLEYNSTGSLAEPNWKPVLLTVRRPAAGPTPGQR